MYTKQELLADSKNMGLQPTHTWAQMSKEYSLFDPEKESACVGIIPNIFRKREGVIRSLHPTHSIAAYGPEAEEYVKGGRLLDVPERLTEKPVDFQIKMPDGSIKEVAVHRHYNRFTPHISEEYDKLAEAYYELGAAKKVKLGDADCILCDAVKIYEVTKKVLSHEINCLIDRKEIPREWWAEEA